jgi:SAM-dependent methyltransferase
VSAVGVIDFVGEKTEQNAYFDSLYEAGQLHKINEILECERTYSNSAELAQKYLNLCGCDLSRGLEDASILDVACGSGWVTAGLLMHPNIRHCRFHAFDISPGGPELLVLFERTVRGSNLLETSVQDAEAMFFEDKCFDFIIGSSVLHHFVDPERFLSCCRRVLRDGGMATFGEPFALGYGLGAAALVVAQKQLGISHPGITKLYADLSVRIKGPDELVAQLVDKHLFLHSTFIAMARRAGFREVEFVPLASREFYRERFIDELLAEHGILDPALSRTASEVYRTVFDLFDAETYGDSVAAFIQLVLRT